MAITDGMVGLILATILIYIFLIRTKTLWKRFVAVGGLYLVALGFGVIADTVIMYIPSAIYIMVATIMLAEDVTYLNR